jgi:hypothetical protein
MFGRDFRVPLELVLPVPDEDLVIDVNADSVDHFVKKLGQTFKHVYGLTREHLQKSVVVQKHYYNRKAFTRKFVVGQSVWLYNPQRKKGRTPKLDKPWDGPYAIVKVLGDVLCEIKLSRRGKSRIVHVDKLVATRIPVAFNWVHILSKGRKEVLPDWSTTSLEGLPKLFDTDKTVQKKKAKRTLDPIVEEEIRNPEIAIPIVIDEPEVAVLEPVVTVEDEVDQDDQNLTQQDVMEDETLVEVIGHDVTKEVTAEVDETLVEVIGHDVTEEVTTEKAKKAKKAKQPLVDTGRQTRSGKSF